MKKISRRNFLIAAGALTAAGALAGCSGFSNNAASTLSSTTMSDSPAVETASSIETAASEQESLPKVIPENYKDLFLAAQDATLYMSAYSTENYFPFWFSWFNLAQFYSYDEILQAAEDPSEEMKVLFEDLASTYANIQQVKPYDDVVIDIWEGHDTLPVPGGIEDDCTSSVAAALCDNENFRPFMTYYPAVETTEVVGTILAVPSIRGGLGELVDVATVFNAMGYHVFTLQPRMNTVEGLGYIDLQLDAQRAIRYIKYHANDYGVDTNKMIVLGGSKGNRSHKMAYEYFNQTPVEVAEELGKPLVNYVCDEIDQIPSNIQVSIVNYGNRMLCDQSQDFDHIIRTSKIYSKENAENGVKFPALYIIIGNQDETQMVADLPALLSGLYNYNTSSDKLYPIPYEIHVMDQLFHGRGMALENSNVRLIWQETDQFIKMNLK